jgi:hypothetical protein
MIEQENQMNIINHSEFKEEEKSTILMKITNIMVVKMLNLIL